MSVNKIDNDVIFNGLITNIKTEQELKDAGSKIVNTYYKNFKNKLKIDSNGMLDWIPENIDKLLKICSSGNKLSSIRIMSEALSNLLLLINKEKYKQLCKGLFLTGINIQKNIDEIKGDQEYTESEDAAKIDLIDLVELRRKYKNMKGYKNHVIYLLLCLNTYMPPLRLEYLNTDTEAITFGDNQLNYITDHDININTDTMMLYINKDKVSNKVGPVQLPFTDYRSKNGTKFIFGNKMRKILRDSYITNPRKFVISSFYDMNEPMSVNSYYRILNTIIGKPVNQNAIRKAYINYYYNQELKLNMNDKDIIAKYMRNSTNIAEKIYKKV
jgi:hypothetical protein